MTGHNSSHSDWERWSLMVGGGVLAAAGLRRGSWAGLAVAAVGGAFAYLGWRCGSVGGCHERAQRIKQAIGAGVNSAAYDHVTQAAKEERHPAGTLIEDVVQEASEDSFPASDPPGWSSGKIDQVTR